MSHSNIKNTYVITVLTFMAIFFANSNLASPSLVYAAAPAANPAPANYTLLAPLPCINGTGNGTCSSGQTIQTINAKSYAVYIFKLMIAGAIFLAIVRIIWGGFQYMTVEAYEGKSDAKGIIQGAIMGLLAALGSYLILYTIDPRLVDISLINPPPLTTTLTQVVAPPITATSTTGGTPTTQTSGTNGSGSSYGNFTSFDPASTTTQEAGSSSQSFYTNQSSIAIQEITNDKNTATHAQNLKDVGDALIFMEADYNQDMSTLQKSNDINGQKALTEQYNVALHEAYANRALLQLKDPESNRSVTQTDWNQQKVQIASTINSEYDQAIKTSTDPTVQQNLASEKASLLNTLQGIQYTDVTGTTPS